jgi:hypothetical protein
MYLLERSVFITVIVSVDGDTAPTRISSFHLLKNIDFSVFHVDTNFKKIYLLVSGQTVYMYNHRYIISTSGWTQHHEYTQPNRPEYVLNKTEYFVTVVAGYDEPDIIDLPESNILGGAIVNKLPVFFSRIHGFVSVTPSDVISPLDFVNSSAMSFDASNLSERMIDEPDFEDVTLYKDSNACLKAAFLYYVSKKSVSTSLYVRLLRL